MQRIANKSLDTEVKFFSRLNVNLDITHRCPLACERCQRFTSFTSQGIKVPGEDISMENFAKVIKYFRHINFCGQVSDPVHHPKFIEILETIRDYPERRSCSVHHASAAKPMRWYEKAFKANPKAQWWFGIDGLPKDSHKYRTHQDGEKLFEVLKLGCKLLDVKPYWQYIVFRYNEDDIQEAYQMSKDVGARFLLINSSRWSGPNDPLRPLNPNHSLDLNT